MAKINQGIVSKIINFENGNMNDTETIELFQELYDSGLVYSLQGIYQRFASQLLQAGLIG